MRGYLHSLGVFLSPSPSSSRSGSRWPPQNDIARGRIYFAYERAQQQRSFLCRYGLKKKAYNSLLLHCMPTVSSSLKIGRIMILAF